MRETIEAGTLSRYDMNCYTFRQLQRDHIRFEEKYTEKFTNSFICRILINYMCYAQKNFLERFEADVTKSLECKKHDEYIKDDRISFTKPLKDKMLEFDFASHKDFKKRAVITCILEQFAELQLSEREKIYCYPQYCLITDVIDESELLLVSLFSGNEYEMKPYRLKVDENTLSYYLIGFSKPKGSEGEFECHSFKLSRIKDCKSKHRESVLSYKEIASAKDISEKFGSAYMARNLTRQEIENTVVWLTEKGYNSLYLKIIAYQRPIPINEPKLIEKDGNRFFELVFDCSHQQIRNYFFSYGAEVEIICPSSLRETFINEYKKAIEHYNPKV